jgi:sialate O-acetylesterase
LAKTYGRTDIVCSGPIYRTLSVEGDRIRLAFDYVGGGLQTRDGRPPTGFEIAGEDRAFVPASAQIDGRHVVVQSPRVPQPVAVRYTWHMTPDPLPNLVNAEGLPALPFHTHSDWFPKPNAE